MNIKSTIIRILAAAAFALLPSFVSAQPDSIRKIGYQADSLRRAYRFQEAMDTYGRALDMFTDSLMTAEDSLLAQDLSDRFLMAENGRNMMDFAYIPKVVARHTFSLEDFFLYYPLPDSSWRATPCQLDTLSNPFSKAVYVPEDADMIYWSAEDKDGIRNIYKSELQDTVWTAPSLLNEHTTSAGNEIYPMVSADGKTMYFASEGLYGLGGYDIYVSEWDEESGDWSVPVNMGFPYSSPADDFLLINTDDSRYTVFASNRDCVQDSVRVYVLEFDSMPVRHSVSDPEELRAIAALEPVAEDVGQVDQAVVETDVPENVDTRRYMEKMYQVRGLRDSISVYGTKIDEARILYGQTSDEDDKVQLTGEITAREIILSILQDSLAKASADLQKIEMEFLFSGIMIDPDKLLAEADREIVGQTADYVFSKRSFGPDLQLDMLKPEVKFDYSFRILPVGQFAEDNTIPDGLVYQIQIFSSYTRANVNQLKGLSPVFEQVAAKGRYTYRVGLFRTYNDVLTHLNAVKRAGFRTAFIVAFHDGKEINVAKARALENEDGKENARSEYYEVRIIPVDGEMDPVITEGIRQRSEGKDIARVELEDGTQVYIVGPFLEKEKADAVADFVKAMDIGEVEARLVPQS